MSNVKKLLASMDNKEKRINKTHDNPYFSSEHIVPDDETNNFDITKHFNRERWLKNKEIHKKIVLSSLSHQFGTLVQNKLKEYQYKCYEKPKQSFMHNFKKQTQVIDQIHKRELISRS